MYARVEITPPLIVRACRVRDVMSNDSNISLVGWRDCDTYTYHQNAAAGALCGIHNLGSTIEQV